MMFMAKRAKSVTYALRGVYVLFKTTPNAWIQALLLLLTVSLGIYFHIRSNDWMMLVFAAGLVLSAEAMNTAFEIDINLTSPEFHPFARDTKDVAAGAVLISAITAVIIGVLIFTPYFLAYFQGS